MLFIIIYIKLIELFCFMVIKINRNKLMIIRKKNYFLINFDFFNINNIIIILLLIIEIFHL